MDTARIVPPSEPAAATPDADTLFDALPIGAYRERPDGLLMRANQALARMHGYATVTELYRAADRDDVPWYVDPQQRRRFNEAMERDGQVRGFVSELRRLATGAHMWVSENAHVVRHGDGSVAYFQGTVEDITERVRAQSAMARDATLLREIAEHIPGMAYRVHMPDDPQRAPYYSFVSPGVRGIYGVEPEAVLADGLLLRRFRHPDDEPAVEAAVRRAMHERAPLNVAFRIVVGGQVRWVQMNSSEAVETVPGEQVRVGVMLDVTAQRQAEELLRERDHAEAKRRQMTQFLSRVSHELRTPLNAILGLAQLIESEPDTPALQRDWAHTLLASGHHLLGLVDDVLDLTGAQSGQMLVLAEDVPAAAAMREAWSLVASAAALRGLRFGGVPPSAEGLLLHADRRRLVQVLTNLMSNAVKYNREGGSVTLGCRAEAGAVQIDITDQGAGMTPGQVARLFNPFDRLGAERGSVPGTGLGLALSLQLTQAMGGTLQATSIPGQGSTFTLRLRAA